MFNWTLSINFGKPLLKMKINLFLYNYLIVYLIYYKSFHQIYLTSKICCLLVIKTRILNKELFELQNSNSAYLYFRILHSLHYEVSSLWS